MFIQFLAIKDPELQETDLHLYSVHSALAISEKEEKRKEKDKKRRSDVEYYLNCKIEHIDLLFFSWINTTNLSDPLYSIYPQICLCDLLETSLPF